MSAYCFSICGVRLLAIHGAKMDWKGRGMRSPSEKRFLRKSWVSDTWMICEWNRSVCISTLRIIPWMDRPC
jgi:hypothetical protein